MLSSKALAKSAPAPGTAKAKAIAIMNAPQIYRFDPQARIAMIRQGIPASTISELSARMGISKESLLSSLGLSRATISRKEKDASVLSKDESERVLGVESLIGMVQSMVEQSGDPADFDAARWVAEWLTKPLPSLGGATPASYMDTFEGQKLVAEMLAMSQSGGLRMNVPVWRIAVEAPTYAANDLSGNGAKMTGGRWNSKGTPMLYCASNIALATLETVHYLRSGGLPFNRYLVRIDIPQNVWAARQILDPLPGGWDAIPAGLSARTAGDHWIAARTSALLLVPSVIVPDEYNVLINPQHPHAASLVATTKRRWIYDTHFFP